MEKSVGFNKVFRYMCAAFALLIPAMSAGPAARESIVALTSRSDAIVVGPTEATVLRGAVRASIRVDRVLKGPVIQGSTLSVTWTMPQSPFGFGKGEASRSTGYGIFFLRQASGGFWSVLSVTNGDVRWEDTYIGKPHFLLKYLSKVASACLPSISSALDKHLQEILSAV
jgi:hypothetical protein